VAVKKKQRGGAGSGAGGIGGGAPAVDDGEAAARSRSEQVSRRRWRRRAVGRALLTRAARVRLLLLDVDGVLTDGRLNYGEAGELMKSFDVRDGHGIVLLREHVELGVISGRPGLARRRLEELRFRHLLFGQRDKLAGYAELAHLGIPDDAVAYMGDDVNDLGLLARVGLSACPCDAHPAVLAAADLVTRAPGGRGAVRELCDLILRAKGLA
jgi:3-deoxy-D-manno-octulosonate 8-phosphate phosphatase (KDO 8-P phosphatase)